MDSHAIMESFPMDTEALLSILNHLNAGIYITDKNRRIILWNHHAEEITGYSASEVVGRACHEDVLCHMDKNGQRLCASGLCPLYRSIQTGVSSKESVLVYANRKDGKKVAVSVSVAPLKDDTGEIIGGIEIFRDETSTVIDLEFAKRIQQSLLPQTLPVSAEFEFDVRYFPYELVGGDFYSLQNIGNGRYAILIADVSGHGVSAALYTMWLKSIEQSLHDLAESPSDFVSALNRELCRYVIPGSFVTLFYGVVDIKAQRMVYVNAGHLPPIHLQTMKDEPTFIKTNATGPPLGINSEELYVSNVSELNAGDLLLFYTDGITEVFEAENRMLGIDGLERLLLKIASTDDASLLDNLYQSVIDKSNQVSLSDDVLLLLVKCKGIA